MKLFFVYNSNLLKNQTVVLLL